MKTITRRHKLRQKLQERMERSWLSLSIRERAKPHKQQQYKSALRFVQINRLASLDKSLSMVATSIINRIAMIDMVTPGNSDMVKGPSNKQLMEDLKISEPTLHKGINELIMSGWVEKKWGGKGRVSRYYPCLPTINTPEQLVNDFKLEIYPFVITKEDLLIDLSEEDKDKKKYLSCELSEQEQKDFSLFFHEYRKLTNHFKKGKIPFPPNLIPQKALINYQEKNHQETNHQGRAMDSKNAL